MSHDFTQQNQPVDPAREEEEVYAGIPAKDVNQIFSDALRMRFARPDASILVQRMATRIQPEVVAAILEGAARLFPIDNSVGGQAVRREIAAERQRRSAAAELRFVTHIRDIGIEFMDEAEQKQHIRTALDSGLQPIRSTPDILFAAPIALRGKQCRWIEYKDYFGFRKNPFVHSKNIKQFKRYVKDFGAGMVIYKLGFQENLFEIEGVSYAREAEALAWFQK